MSILPGNHGHGKGVGRNTGLRHHALVAAEPLQVPLVGPAKGRIILCVLGPEGGKGLAVPVEDGVAGV